MVTSNAGLEVGRSSGRLGQHRHQERQQRVPRRRASGIIRNTELNANSFFSRFPDGLKRNQGGATLGGPVTEEQALYVRRLPAHLGAEAAGGGQTLNHAGSLSQRRFFLTASGHRDQRPSDRQRRFPAISSPRSRFSAAAQALLQFSPLPDPDGFTRYTCSPGRHQRLRRSRRLPADPQSTIFWRAIFQQDFTESTPAGAEQYPFGAARHCRLHEERLAGIHASWPVPP